MLMFGTANAMLPQISQIYMFDAHCMLSPALRSGMLTFSVGRWSGAESRGQRQRELFNDACYAPRHRIICSEHSSAGGGASLWQRRARRKRQRTLLHVAASQLQDLPASPTKLKREIEHALGTIVVRPVSEQDVKAATVLLTRSFATTGYLPLDDAGQYCLDMLQQQPQGLLLVARLHGGDAGRLPEGQDSRLVGTVALSFDRNTREEFPTLQPPDDAAYLSNMAVCPSFRRQGLARQLLRICEELCEARGLRRLYLHARLGDDPALRLYQGAAYQAEAQDSFLVKLRGITPRALMYKELPAGTAAGAAQGAAGTS